jgi:hypothetical protein
MPSADCIICHEGPVTLSKCARGIEKVARAIHIFDKQCLSYLVDYDNPINFDQVGRRIS